MPHPWSKPLDVDRLSRGAAVLEFDIALAELPRLRSHAELTGGAVRGAVRFGRESRTAIVEVSFEGSAMLRCQRCMRPMALPLSVRARVALLASAADADAVPETLEPVLAADGRISVGELVEEEVLLGLPIVPMHEGEGPCQPLEQAERAEQVSTDAATQRPFARLGELLSHK